MDIIWVDLFITLFTISAGIVVSGFTYSLYQAMTQARPKFSMLDTSGVKLILNIFIIIFMGPMMIIRNCYYGRVLEGRPMAYVFGGAAIAASWGMVTGLYITHMAINMF